MEQFRHIFRALPPLGRTLKTFALVVTRSIQQ